MVTNMLRRTILGLVVCALLFGTAAAPACAAEDGAEHPSASNPLSVDPDLALFTALVFVLLLAVLWKFAWGPICEALDARERRISENIAAAERAGEDARKLIGQYEDKLAGAANEVREILEEARRDADHTRQEIVEEARQAADVERRRALREIDTATTQALKELAEQSANLAVGLAGKIVRAELDAKSHSALIQESMAKFTASPSKN